MHSFFKNVFQSPILIGDPILNDNATEDIEYNKIVFSTDKEISMDEIEKACEGIGTGTSLDGIPPAVCRFLPPALKTTILNLLYPQHSLGQTTFTSNPKNRTQLIHRNFV